MFASNSNAYRVGVVVAEYTDSRPGEFAQAVISSMHRNRIADEVLNFNGETGDFSGTSVVAAVPKVETAPDLAMNLLKIAVDEGQQDPMRAGVAVRLGIGFGEVSISDGIIRGVIVQRLRRSVSRLPPNSIGVAAPILDYLLESARRDARPMKNDQDTVGLMPLWILPLNADLSPSTQHTPATSRAEAAIFTELSLVTRGKATNIGPSQCPFMIGRDPTSNIALSGPAASRQHARIVYDSGKFYYIDDSTNGSYILTSAGSEVLIKRERFFLLGKGAISPGCPIGDQTNEIIRFDASPRQLDMKGERRSTTERFG